MPGALRELYNSAAALVKSGLAEIIVLLVLMIVVTGAGYLIERWRRRQ
jgi:hypothetical protein